MLTLIGEADATNSSWIRIRQDSWVLPDLKRSQTRQVKTRGLFYCFWRPVGGIWGESGVEARQEGLNIKPEANFDSLSVFRQTP